MIDNPAVAVAMLGLLLNLLVTIIGGVWKLSRLELSLRDAIDASGSEIDERIERQAREAREQIERQSREIGETASALRTKITDLELKISKVELWSRDTFVRRDSFFKVSEGLTAQLQAFAERIEARIARMEDKIDHQH